MRVTTSISFLICTRNRAEIVRECVQSLLDFPRQDFEVIVRDNCSTDNTVELLNCIKDKRLKIHVASENQGTLTFYEISKLASGEIVTWLSDEDSFQFDELNYIIERFNHNANCNVMFGGIVVGAKARSVTFSESSNLGAISSCVMALLFSGCGGVFVRRSSLPSANSFIVRTLDDAYCLWNYYPVGFFASRCVAQSLMTTSRIVVRQTRFAKTTNNWSEVEIKGLKRPPHYYPEVVYDRLISNLVNICFSHNSSFVKFSVAFRLILIFIRSSCAYMDSNFIQLLKENYSKNVVQNYIANIVGLGLNNFIKKWIWIGRKIILMPKSFLKTKECWNKLCHEVKSC